MPHFDYDVFLSFASLNEALARPLYERLTGSGLRVFWSDETLKKRVGQSWFRVIEESLESSKHFVVLWTEEAKHSKFVKLEYETFRAEAIRDENRLLIPLIRKGFGAETMPLFLRHLQAYDLDGDLGPLIKQLGGRYEPLELENARLREQLEEAEKKVNHLQAAKGTANKAELEALKEEHESLKKNYILLENQIIEDRSQYDGQLKTLSDTNSALNEKLASERQNHRALKKERATLANEKAAEIRGLTVSVEKKDKEIDGLKKSLSKAQKRERQKPMKPARFSLSSGVGGAFLGAVLMLGLYWLGMVSGSSIPDNVMAGTQVDTTAIISIDTTQSTPANEDDPANADDLQDASEEPASQTPTPPPEQNPAVTRAIDQPTPRATSQKASAPAQRITRDGIDFVYIPAGEFLMGSVNGEADESPVHKVKITKEFYLGKTEVTQAQWKDVMGYNPSRFKDDNRPVESVSWDSVQVFIRRLNQKANCTTCYRLPTEAEWEYAARTGTNSAYGFGNDESMLEDYAWYRGNARSETHPVARKDSSSWGLYDMHGNVWEWVTDWYDKSYYEQFQNKTAIDPTGPERGTARVFRGGSWYNNAGSLRSAFRSNIAPGYANSHIGFRLLRTLP